MAFEKLPAVEGSLACATCGAGARSDLQLDEHICVGFGSAGFSRDGETLWSEQGEEFEDTPTVRQVEEFAKQDPDRDWRIFYFAPMYEAEYQRQGDGFWVLIRKGEGFV